MPFIGPRMHCNSICSKTLCVYCGFDHIRVIAAPAVSKCGNFIDVNRKFRHNSNVRNEKKQELKES